jgi:hypothetical protein
MSTRSSPSGHRDESVSRAEPSFARLTPSVISSRVANPAMQNLLGRLHDTEARLVENNVVDASVQWPLTASATEQELDAEVTILAEAPSPKGADIAETPEETCFICGTTVCRFTRCQYSCGFPDHWRCLNCRTKIENMHRKYQDCIFCSKSAASY